MYVFMLLAIFSNKCGCISMFLDLRLFVLGMMTRKYIKSSLLLNKRKIYENYGLLGLELMLQSVLNSGFLKERPLLQVTQHS